MSMLAKLLPAAGLLTFSGIFAAAAGPAGASPAWSLVQSEASSGTSARRVCRDITPSGTRLTQRRCRTQAEWDDEATKAGESLRQNQTDRVRQTTVNRPGP